LRKLRLKRSYTYADYEFDPAKEEANLAKHGVSLTLAEVLFAGPHVSVQDDRFDYGEVREVAFWAHSGAVVRMRLRRSRLDASGYIFA
jgi:uncharacterized DUF497 family protein